MKVYCYDRKTKEYIGTDEAYLDRVASMREGQPVYAMPAYTTQVAVPEVPENKVALYSDGKWILRDDYRGKMVYNLDTREGTLWDKIGVLPNGYTLNLPESANEIQEEYLAIIKNNFKIFMATTKVNIPDTENSFLYSSLSNLQKEKETGVCVSRDDNNNVYTFTTEQYAAAIDYLTVFGQLLYLTKWTLENKVKACKDVDLLKAMKDELTISYDLNNVKSVYKLNEEKRKNYYLRLAKNI